VEPAPDDQRDRHGDANQRSKNEADILAAHACAPQSIARSIRLAMHPLPAPACASAALVDLDQAVRQLFW